MRIAALERFPEPSRQYELAKVGSARHDVSVWELPHPRIDRDAFTADLRRGARHWVDRRLPLPERFGLLRACLQTPGARLGALALGPELLVALREGKFDKLGCYSAKDFALVRFLAERAGLECDEMLARGTKYLGEFAFELLAVVPYAYWLHRQGRLEFTISTADTDCLYYFSPQHEERDQPRRYVPITEYPVGRRGLLRYDHLGFPSSLDTRRWLPPPYREVYGGDRFPWARPACLVFNKTSDESYLRRGLAVNTMDPDLTLAVISKLRHDYQVIYIRPRASDIVADHQEIYETGDLAAVTGAYPDVLTVQQLHAQNPDLTFNELQLRLLASSERFVSVLGGASYLASYFGGTNVVYASRGWEVKCNAYRNWFHLFSGARVVAARTPRELLSAIDRELLGRSAVPAT